MPMVRLFRIMPELIVDLFRYSVLTRAAVYGGIGVLCFEVIPVCFELVGVGLR
jgi:hypothetical protein